MLIYTKIQATEARHDRAYTKHTKSANYHQNELISGVVIHRQCLSELGLGILHSVTFVEMIMALNAGDL